MGKNETNLLGQNYPFNTIYANTIKKLNTW